MMINTFNNSYTDHAQNFDQLSQDLNIKFEDKLIEAAKNNHLETLKLLSQTNPDAFKTFLATQSSYVDLLLYGFDNANLEMVKWIIAQADPNAFKTFLTIKEDVYIALSAAIHYNNLEIVQFIAQADPDVFKAVLTVNNTSEGTLLHLVCWQDTINLEMMEVFIKANPEALTILNKCGDSVLSLLKERRPKNYHEALQLLKNNVILKQHHKVFIQRKALGHAFHLSGESPLVTRVTGDTLAKIKLEGHLSYEWFHLMSKHFPSFKECYPDLLSQQQMTLLEDLFNLGANENLYSIEDKIRRIQDGLPVIISAGYDYVESEGDGGHTVSLLIWGNQFIICNRGSASRQPIEVYHFDPLKINKETLQKIHDIYKRGSEQDYLSFFFSILPQQLGFSQNTFDCKMQEAACLLPFQIVDNCTFVSPTTGIFAFLLMSTLRGSDKHNCSLNEKLEKQEWPKGWPEEKIKRAIVTYETWLSHLQMSFLEKSIRSLDKEDDAFLSDRHLIQEVLNKAHLLPLDPEGEQKLKEFRLRFFRR